MLPSIPPLISLVQEYDPSYQQERLDCKVNDYIRVAMQGDLTSGLGRVVYKTKDAVWVRTAEWMVRIVLATRQLQRLYDEMDPFFFGRRYPNEEPIKLQSPWSDMWFSGKTEPFLHYPVGEEAERIAKMVARQIYEVSIGQPQFASQLFYSQN